MTTPNVPNVAETYDDLKARLSAAERRATDAEALLATAQAKVVRLREALDTIANPRRGTPEESWDVTEIGNIARAALAPAKAECREVKG